VIAAAAGHFGRIHRVDRPQRFALTGPDAPKDG
jgi:hypothetical protein